jgi:hypothetical protein
VQHDTSLPSAPLAFFTFMMLLSPVINCEPHDVMLEGYRYAMRHGMEVQVVTPHHACRLQCSGVMERNHITSVYPHLECLLNWLFSLQGNRDESRGVDHAAAEQDAQALQRAGKY